MKLEKNCHLLGIELYNNFLIQISEIFYSFQGESSLVGNPTLFVRFSGCNLRCKICDTKYSLKPGKYLSIDEILLFIKKIDCPYVCITGGEPLLQPNGLIQLVKRLHKMGKIISIETNGSYSVKKLPKYVKKVLDVKTPSTGHGSSFYKGNINLLTNFDELKFVISNEADYNFSKNFIIKNRIEKTGCKIIFSPNLNNKFFDRKLINWILSDELKVVFGPQLHKLINEDVRWLF